MAYDISMQDEDQAGTDMPSEPMEGGEEGGAAPMGDEGSSEDGGMGM